MIFDYCRAQADTAAGDAVRMDLGKDKKGKGDKKEDENDKGTGKKGKKGKSNAKATEYFASDCLHCKAWSHIKNWWWKRKQQDREGRHIDDASCRHHD